MERVYSLLGESDRKEEDEEGGEGRGGEREEWRM